MSKRAPCSKCGHHPGDPTQRYPDVLQHGKTIAILAPWSSAWGIEETIREVDHFSDARVDWAHLDEVHIVVRAMGSTTSSDLREAQRILFAHGLNFDPNEFDLPGMAIEPEIVGRNRFVPRSQG